MKNKLSVLCALSLCALMLLSTVAPLRLHVVANSDSFEDQRIKLAVRDAVLSCMGQAENKEAAMLLAMEEGEALQAACEQVLQEEGAAYGVKLYLGQEAFPLKTYGEKVYPAGDYTALRVVLGEGEGQNWWCVIYPPLCLGKETDQEQKVVYQSLLGEFLKMLFG